MHAKVSNGRRAVADIVGNGCRLVGCVCVRDYVHSQSIILLGDNHLNLMLIRGAVAFELAKNINS